MKKNLIARAAAGLAGAALIAGVGAAAYADDKVGDSNGVDVNVQISERDTGTLAMTVAGGSAPLTETASGDPAVRQFDGTLPTVTVTDTRTAEEIPDGAFWWVEGIASSFIGDNGQRQITPDHLGWQPYVEDDGEGTVAVGQDVGTVLDEAPANVGLSGDTLLALSLDSASSIGTWEATAGLTLKVPVETEDGAYHSTLTLSLFE